MNKIELAADVNACDRSDFARGDALLKHETIRLKMQLMIHCNLDFSLVSDFAQLQVVVDIQCDGFFDNECGYAGIDGGVDNVQPRIRRGVDVYAVGFVC